MGFEVLYLMDIHLLENIARYCTENADHCVLISAKLLYICNPDTHITLDTKTFIDAHNHWMTFIYGRCLET